MREKIEDNQIQQLINIIDIPFISEDINFWLIRTQGGMFYDEFISDGFIALGWSDIAKQEIDEANKSDKKKDEIKDKISKTYNTKQPGSIFNKCERFIKDIKENDIFMIPSKGSQEISFALAKDYYEDDYLVHKENEIEELIKNGWENVFSLKCPYKKRRKIEVIKTISSERLNPNLYRALISYHGLSKINDSSSYILSSIYPIYYYQENLSIVYRVRHVGKIDAMDYSSFIYHTSSILREVNNGNRVSIKSNVQSPGDLIFELAEFGVDAFKTALPYFLSIWGAAGGGKILGFDVKSIGEYIIKSRESKSKLKNEELDRELKKLEIEGKKLDLIEKEIDLNQKLYQIKNSSSSLEIDTSELTNIIDFTKYQEQKNCKNNDD